MTTPALPSEPYLQDDAYDELKSAVRRHLGVDLDYYKPHQMKRRLSGFLERRRASSVQEFCVRLQTDGALRSELKDFLTINVTEFFRDARQFETLEKEVLPQVLRDSASPRIWSAGCSRGAEAYSVAMILEGLRPGGAYSILGTDLDRAMVDTARAGGPYVDQDLRGVTPARLAKYFTASPSGRSVKQQLRARVKFEEGNLLTGRFEAGFDLIMCRNVVIYFSDEAKDELNRRFAASLKPGGFLFIGGTETLMDPKSVGFERTHSCFYRKVSKAAERLAA
jgi:chemotaxis protein methyltransferase CheR